MGIPGRQRGREEARKPVVKQIAAKDRKHAGGGPCETRGRSKREGRWKLTFSFFDRISD
jgi:hypothetical protein